MATASEWIDLTIPGSAPPVRLLRLHVDPETRASTALVRFPAGWCRPGGGHYTAGEWFAVLCGELEVSANTYRAGDAAWIAPLTSRTDSSSAAGALALAWFSGPAHWVPADT